MSTEWIEFCPPFVERFSWRWYAWTFTWNFFIHFVLSSFWKNSFFLWNLLLIICLYCSKMAMIGSQIFEILKRHYIIEVLFWCMWRFSAFVQLVRVDQNIHYKSCGFFPIVDSQIENQVNIHDFFFGVFLVRRHPLDPWAGCRSVELCSPKA